MSHNQWEPQKRHQGSKVVMTIKREVAEETVQKKNNGTIMPNQIMRKNSIPTGIHLLPNLLKY
jgi:hypothetical protein